MLVGKACGARDWKGQKEREGFSHHGVYNLVGRESSQSKESIILQQSIQCHDSPSLESQRFSSGS